MVAAKPIGIIDALASGFTVVHRRLGLLLIPVIADFLYWTGPRITAAAPLSSVLEAPSAGPAPIVGFDPLGLNLMALLSFHLPSLARAPSLSSLPMFSPWLPLRIELTSWPMLLIAVLALGVLGLLLASLYLQLLAGPIRGEDSRLTARSFERLPQRTRALAGALLIVLGLTTSVGAILLAVSERSAMNLLPAFGLWVALLFFFVDAAIFVGGLGAIAALRQSISLVWRQFWPCLGIFAALQVISVGLPLFWARLPGNFLNQPWGALIAIPTHLYLLSGLTAGVMGFYKSRVAALAPARI